MSHIGCAYFGADARCRGQLPIGMKRYGPLLTLLVGALVAGGLAVANTIASRPAAAPRAAAAAATTPVPTTAAAIAPSVPSSPRSPAAVVNAVWAGQVAGDGGAIAIAVKNGVAIAYLCDGRRIEAWLHGMAAGGVLSLTGTGGARLDGTFGNGTASGRVTASGRTWTFTAPAVRKPSGLYRATARVRNARVVGGWIVWGNGRQTGVLTVNDEPQSAPPLDVDTGIAVVGGTPISAEPVN
jgi:serine/threonine-protein kinase